MSVLSEWRHRQSPPLPHRIIDKLNAVVEALDGIIAYFNAQKRQNLAGTLIAQEHGYAENKRIQGICTHLRGFCKRQVFHKHFAAAVNIMAFVLVHIRVQESLFATKWSILHCTPVGGVQNMAFHAAFRAFAAMWFRLDIDMQ